MNDDDERDVAAGVESGDEAGVNGGVNGGVELSALVMLRPTPQDHALGEQQTSNDLAGALPNPAAVEALRATFTKLGFDVGPAVAISFSISGPDRLFDDVFPSAAPVLKSLQSRSSPDDSQGGSHADSQGELFLPTDDLRSHDSGQLAGISAIFFPEAPDFGPGNP